jgi:hypothetical protein
VPEDAVDIRVPDIVSFKFNHRVLLLLCIIGISHLVHELVVEMLCHGATLVELTTMRQELLALLVLFKLILLKFEFEVQLLRLYQEVLSLRIRYQTKPRTINQTFLRLGRQKLLREVDDSIVGYQFVLHGCVLD